jgi:ElaB/YqjD/DUF883 family membrane-anchored ribosome-binding protein
MGERADEIMHPDPLTTGGEGTLESPDTLSGAPASESVSGTNPTDLAWSTDEGMGETGDIEYPAEEGDDVEATRAQIEQTRADLSETIDAIQQKLSPQNLAEQAKSTVRDATVGKAGDMVSNVTDTAKQAVSNAGDTAKQAVSSAGDTAKETVSSAGDSAKGFGSTFVETVRQNPVPAALAGIGLGWLFMSARKQSSSQVQYQPREYDSELPYSYSGDYSYRYRDYGDKGTARQTLNKAQDAVGNVTDRAQSAMGDTVSQAQDKAGQVAGQVQDTAGQMADQVQSQASQLSNQAQYQTQRAAGGFQQMVEERPLAVAAGALALGVAVGLAVPSTPQEQQLMGQARDTLMDQAQQRVQETAGKVQSVAQEAMGAAKDAAQQEAQNQNLTS